MTILRRILITTENVSTYRGQGGKRGAEEVLGFAIFAFKRKPVRDFFVFFGIAFLFITQAVVPVMAQTDEPSENASEPSPEEIIFQEVDVVTAAKRAQKRSQAPAAIRVITAEDIKKFGARTIAEAIQYETGLNIFGISGVNIRGVGSGARILLLVDGARANDVFTGGFETGLERQLDYVERIEVIKGPASSLYGTNAFAGIIHIITKKPQKNQDLTVKAAGGNFTTQNYSVLWGRDTDTLDGLFSLSAYASEGHDILGTNDSLRALDLFAKIQWKEFTFSGGYRPNRTGIPSIGNLLTPTSFIKRSDTFSHLFYEKDLSNHFILFSQLSLQHENLFLADPAENSDFRDLRIEGEARGTYVLNDKDSLTFGVELRRDRTNNVKTSASEQFKSHNTSFFAENELRFTERLSVTTGLRVDDNSVFGSSVNPRAGVVWTLPQGTIVKGFVGRAFRGPEFLSLFTDIKIGNFIIVRNPLLKPETVVSYEAEISYPFRNWLEAQVNIYHNSLRDLISGALVENVFTSVNVGEASSDGVEVSLKAKIGKQIDVFANHSFQFVEDDISKTRLPLIPRNTTNLGVTFRSPKSFTIGAYAKYIGERPSTDLTGKPINLPDRFKMDLTASARIHEDWEFSIAVYNLFDVQNDENVIDTNPTQVLAGLSCRCW